MKKKVFWYLKNACLLPVATVIWLFRHIQGVWAILLGTVLCFSVMFTQCQTKNEAKLAAIQRETSTTETAAPSISTYPSPETDTGPVSITLSFAGDCTLGTDMYFDEATSFNAMYESQGKDYFFENVRDIFRADDLTVINFEGTLTDSTARADKDYAFKGAAEYASVLSSGGVEAANLANNHSCDYRQESFTDTKTALKAADIVHFGFDDTYLNLSADLYGGTGYPF